MIENIVLFLQRDLLYSKMVNS